ncbi:MAG: hypothetical protein ACAI37_18435 [Chthoniobacter sp.]
MKIDDLIENSPWTAEDLAEASPVAIPADCADQVRAMLNLFASEHTLWVGYSVSPDGHIVEGWCEEQALLLAHAESLEWIEPYVISQDLLEYEWGARKELPCPPKWFLVIATPREFADEQGGNRTVGLFVWLVSELGLELKAVVRHGEKLEGWYAGPPKAAFEALAVVLPLLNICEEYCFKFHQLAVLPNRNNGARLIYLSK